MEERTRNTMSRTPQLEDVPELIQLIQSWLPEKEATRTCVLSKSWLHAWSTIPTLRFYQCSIKVTEEKETKYITWIDHTLQRYHQDDIPIQTFDLYIDITNQKLVSLAQKWISLVVSKSCLKNLSLVVWDIMHPFNKYLNTIMVTTNVMVKCVYLRILKLRHVHVSDEVLDNLLSTCSLLEKINLLRCKGLKTIKVKNLSCLRELEINSINENDILEIDCVRNLHLFYYSPPLKCKNEPLQFNMDSLGNVTQLRIDCVKMDTAFFDMIKLKFPLLESLTLRIGYGGPKSFIIKNVSLKILTLITPNFHEAIDVKVHAPNLELFCYRGYTIPTLLFPTIVPERIKLWLNSSNLNHPFLLKIRDLALNISSRFDVVIEHFGKSAKLPLNTHVDRIRRETSFPVTNVQQLLLIAHSDEHLWERTWFFDAFFQICRPNYVEAKRPPLNNSKCFSKLMVKGLMERKPSDLKDVELKNPSNGKWEVITSSWRSILDKLDNRNSVEFKLNWCSQ